MDTEVPLIFTGGGCQYAFITMETLTALEARHGG